MRRALLGALFVSAVVIAAAPASATGGASTITLDAGAWRVVERESGPVNYYKAMREGSIGFIRAKYAPPMETTVLGWKTPDADRKRIKKVRWNWRAQTLPRGGNECEDGKGDSAAVVYVTWKRGLKYYTLKYIWSGAGKKGTVCRQHRNMFVAQDAILIESGGPLNTWRAAEIDLATEFRNHFEGGDPNAEVPDFVGLGLLTDGDQTKTPSSADYGQFTLTR